MAKLGVLPGLDITKPIKVDIRDYQGLVSFPEDLAVFNSSDLLRSSWFVAPGSIPKLKKEVGFENPLVFTCSTSSNSGHFVRFQYVTHTKAVQNFEIGYNNMDFIPFLTISISDIISFLKASEQDAWIFIAKKCKLDRIKRKFAQMSLSYYGVDFSTI